jgi:hypothetical protein
MKVKAELNLAQDRVQWRNFCEHGNEHSGSLKGGNSLTS